MKIAILGTGTMGLGIGSTLIQKKHTLSIYNRTPGNAQPLIDKGARFHSTVAKAIEGAEIVILMPWNKDALESMSTGDTGTFNNAAENQIFINMSTQLPQTATWEASHYAKRKAHFLDAPVHGSKGEAYSGGLWIMVGGDKDIYTSVIPLFEAIGESHHYMGKHGNGYATKLCGNHLVSSIVAALGESITLAKKAGLDLKEVLGVWMDSDFRSPVVEGVGGSMISRDFEVSFHLRTMVKDTELIRMLLGIKTIARKQRMMINKWQDVNEGWETDDYIQTKLTTLIGHSMTNIESDEKETSKIIRAISKHVYLDNEEKNKYLC